MIPIKPPLLQTIIHPAFEQQSLKVQVLRMDVIHPQISGNKWMKLLPWFELAKENGNTGILTVGGPWSNHVHAAAFLAKAENLYITTIIKAKNGMMTPMLADAKQWGATILYDELGITKEADYKQAAAASNLLFIAMGGEGETGVAGVRSYFKTLALPGADYLICPVGTGTTLKGLAHSGIYFKTLMGVNPGINDADYETLLGQLSDDFPAKEFLMLGHKELKKFGKWPEHLPADMNGWYRQWQLPTDIVYTAKMFFIFMQQVNSGYFKTGASILLLHTGGLQGNRSLPGGLLAF